MVGDMLIRQMMDIDTDPETKENSGKISFQDMKEIFQSSAHLCAKEINLLLRTYVLKYGYDQIVYTDLIEDIFQVRFDFLSSRLMDINVQNMKDDFL